MRVRPFGVANRVPVRVPVGEVSVKMRSEERASGASRSVLGVGVRPSVWEKWHECEVCASRMGRLQNLACDVSVAQDDYGEVARRWRKLALREQVAEEYEVARGRARRARQRYRLALLDMNRGLAWHEREGVKTRHP